jgi:hypothetical protein
LVDKRSGADLHSERAELHFGGMTFHLRVTFMTPPAIRGLVLSAIGVLCAAMPCSAQSANDPPTYTRDSVFRIPFQTDAGGRLKQVQLYVSTDKGTSWRQEAAVVPTERFFDFRAPQDGLYWFTVRTVDLENRAHPPTLDGARPGLRVVVDTQPPVVRLKAQPPRDGEINVEWDVRDENLSPSGIRLDYRLPGGNWVPVGSDLPATGQRSWRPGTNGAVEIRLSAEDRAGNRTEEKNPGATGEIGGRPSGETFGTATPPRSAAPQVRLVNSKRIGLNYEIKDKGPSGISAIELWFTQDASGRSWQKWKEEDGKSPPPFVVDVNGEGLYGFTLVVRSGVGLGDRPPQVGDPPHCWVEVDLTKPVARLTSVDVGRGAESGRLTIRWIASDKNLGPQPITLSYSEQAGGPWKPIAGSLENTGSYVWQMPKDIPYQFLIRVEALDRAGNAGADETPKPVIVDLLQPKGVIVGVEPLDK